MGEVSITNPHCDSKYSEMHTKSRSMSAINISSGHHKLFFDAHMYIQNNKYLDYKVKVCPKHVL